MLIWAISQKQMAIEKYEYNHANWYRKKGPEQNKFNLEGIQVIGNKMGKRWNATISENNNRNPFRKTVF